MTKTITTFEVRSPTKFRLVLGCIGLSLLLVLGATAYAVSPNPLEKKWIEYGKLEGTMTAIEKQAAPLRVDRAMFAALYDTASRWHTQEAQVQLKSFKAILTAYDANISTLSASWAQADRERTALDQYLTKSTGFPVEQ